MLLFRFPGIWHPGARRDSTFSLIQAARDDQHPVHGLPISVTDRDADRRGAQSLEHGGHIRDGAPPVLKVQPAATRVPVITTRNPRLSVRRTAWRRLVGHRPRRRPRGGR